MFDNFSFVVTVNGYAMKEDHTHGIDDDNLRLPPKSWRLIVLLRNLQPLIKKAALRHKEECKNQDMNEDALKKCICKQVDSY